MSQRELFIRRSAGFALVLFACAGCEDSGALDAAAGGSGAGGSERAALSAQAGPPAAAPAGPTAPTTTGALEPDPAEGRELLARIDCTADHREFGRVWQGAVVAHEFTFTAAGDHPLEILDFRPDCGCTVAHLEVVADDGTRTPYVLKTPVPPGTRFALAVTFDTENREGHQAKTVKIYGNIPEGVRTMTVAADIAPLIRVEPRSQAIELMSVLESREAEYAVRTSSGQRFALTPRRTGLPDALLVEVSPVDPDADGRAVTWNVRALLNPGLPKGIKTYTLELETDITLPDSAPGPDGKPAPFVVKPILSAVVVGHVSVSPQNVNFGMLGAHETAARTVRLVSHDPGFALPEPKVELKPAKPDQPFPLAETLRVTTRKVEGANEWEIELLLEGLSPAVGRSFLARAVIETGHPEEPRLEVVLSGLKRGN